MINGEVSQTYANPPQVKEGKCSRISGKCGREVYARLAVYRELDQSAVRDRGHTGILIEYTGQCSKEDIEDDMNYEVIEMSGGLFDQPRRLLLAMGGFKQPERVYWGTYTSSDLTDTKSLKIIKNARDIADSGFGDNRIKYVLPDVLKPSPWDGRISTITHLRCDGLVDACYEMAGVLPG